MARHKKGRYGRAPSAKKPPLTHFLCLPLITTASKPQLEHSLKAFTDATSPQPERDPEPSELKIRDEISNEEGTLRFVPAKAIRPLGTLHFTLGVMSLGQDQVKEATEYLQALDLDALLSSANASETQSNVAPLKINLTGLHSMHEPVKTSILYAAPEDLTGKLYPFCVALQKEFTDRGVLISDDRELKLHATIVNTIYAKGSRLTQDSSKVQGSSTQTTDRSQGHGPNAKAPLKLDATKLLDQYKDYVWAENIILDRLAICEMGAKKVFDDTGKLVEERYTEVASIQLSIL